jgi:hypothetical protein
VQVRDAEVDRLGIPERAILLLEQQQAARAIDTRSEARGVQVPPPELSLRLSRRSAASTSFVATR